MGVRAGCELGSTAGGANGSLGPSVVSGRSWFLTVSLPGPAQAVLAEARGKNQGGKKELFEK